MTRRKASIISIASVVLAGLLFTGTAWAHDLTARSALGELRPYVQRVLNDPNVPFTNAVRSCRRGGGGHLQACTVSYDTVETRAAEAQRQSEWVCPVPPRTPCGPRRPKRIAPFACFEQIQAYYKSHPLIGGRSLDVHLKHTSRPCGRSRLLGR